MGVSGDAQTRWHVKSFLYSHFHAPLSHVTLRPHGFVMHAVPVGSSHGAPWFGVTPGQFSLSTSAGEHRQTFVPCGSLPQSTVQPGTWQHWAQLQKAVW